MSSTFATTTKCSKPKGVSCRIHNPAPQFTNVNDVWAKTAIASKNRRTAITSTTNKPRFLNINDTRRLATNIPEDVKEHMALSVEQLKHLTETEHKALSGYTGFAAGVCNQILHGKEYHYYDMAPLWQETQNGPTDFSTQEDLVTYMETMDEVLSIRNKDPKIVYRGTPVYAELHNKIGEAAGIENIHPLDTEGLMKGLAEYYKPGTIIDQPTYVSTSSSAFIAAERTSNIDGIKATYWDGEPEVLGLMYEMKTNTGVDVTGVAGSPYVREREVVLPRDTHWKVTGISLKPEQYITVSGNDNQWKPEKKYGKTFTKIAAVIQMVEVDADGNEITHTQPHKPTRKVDSYFPSE